MAINVADSHSQTTLSQWNKLETILANITNSISHLGDDKCGVRINSKSLDLASIVAVSRLAKEGCATKYRPIDIYARYGAHALEESLGEVKIIFGKRIFACFGLFC